MKNGKILIIDDNEDVLFALNLLLEPYVEQIKVTTQPERIEHFMSTFVPDVILLDMNFRRDAISGQEGFFWLEKIKAADPDAVVLFITAYADTEKAVRAIKAGATDFIPKPWEKEKLLATLSAALKLRESRTEINTLKQRVEALGSPDDTGFEIIGESDVMQDLFATIAKLKDTDANILILGENGTGKDLIARALFHHSPRCNQVFISIDLGSIPEQLFESELFGYEKGAFTDARRDKPGRMEVASGGTLFLDEIGNLSLPMQAKLLTAIEKRQILRLGATRSVPIDVRLISATNMDIHAMVQEGTFRQDLLYRINTIELHIPPRCPLRPWMAESAFSQSPRFPVRTARRVFAVPEWLLQIVPSSAPMSFAACLDSSARRLSGQPESRSVGRHCRSAPESASYPALDHSSICPVRFMRRSVGEVVMASYSFGVVWNAMGTWL